LTFASTAAKRPGYVYEVRPRKDKRGVDLISDVLPFGRLWCGEPNAISYAKFFSRSYDAVIRVYDSAGNVIETHSRPDSSKSGGSVFHPAGQSKAKQLKSLTWLAADRF
jgi:hypothetical protein